ncbi:MAG: tsaD N6-L-threonylcarbamoyladenine synthase [Candidatus Parcubacteria bacterium]|jgi:N6-L-threonylcarbamoyladenine synthase
MRILAIDTSCDETAAAVTDGRKVLAQALYSQVTTHKQWGGVVPSLARRAHEERIDGIIAQTIKKYNIAIGNKDLTSYNGIDYLAVTYGPGLAIALEVGMKKAQELALKHNKQIIPVNHMEGHIYSCFVQNRNANPKREFSFPYLALLISGAHTEIVLVTDHITYKVLGETRDDAAGEALDKAARMLGFGYPGGPTLERLAKQIDNSDTYKFPRPMIGSKDLAFSFSGLKTSFLYFLRQMPEDEKLSHLKELSSSFQEAVFDTLKRKLTRAIDTTGVNNIIVGGGVAANKRLRYILRAMIKTKKGSIYFPVYSYLTGDNAAMIGVVASYKAEKGMICSPADLPDRVPRLTLG